MTGLRPPLTRLRSGPRPVALLVALSTTALAPIVTAIAPASAAVACTADHSVVGSWSSGFQGAVRLTRKHPREAVCRGARLALENRLFRYKDLCRLVEQAPRQQPLDLITDHPSIRPLDHYRLEELT